METRIHNLLTYIGFRILHPHTYIGFRLPKLTSPLSPEMPEININIDGVRRLMKNLDPFKASGPDKVQSRFLKLMAEELSAGMALIFTASLHQAKMENA